MDDVDYTILAATTVLGNLMEKCPPAEACRDAFDRMAKATVQMCMGTTGFGSRAPMLGAPQSSKQSRPDQLHSPSSSTQSSPAAMMIPSPSSPHQLIPNPQIYAPRSDGSNQFRTPRRPRPQFGMNLRDLFPEDTAEQQNFRNVGWQATLPQVQQMPPPPPQQQMPYPPPPSHTSSSPLSQFTSPTFSTSGLPGGTPAPPNPGYTYPNAGLQGVDQNINQQQQQQPFDGFMFHSDLDDLLADSNTAYSGQPGLSLGFDTDHDWNDGMVPDMFDGFWFRGWNGLGNGEEGGDGGSGDGTGEDEVMSGGG